MIILKINALFLRVERELYFVVSPTKYVEDIESEIQQLKETARDVQHNRDMAVVNKEVVPIVEEWLLDVENSDKRRILLKQEPVGCFNVTKRYNIGRRFYSIHQQIEDLQKQGSKITFTHEKLCLDIGVGSTSTAPDSLSSIEYSDIPQYPDIDKREQPNLPSVDLTSDVTGGRYFNVCVPLFEASMRCDWNTAKAIFYKNPCYAKYGITGNKETALHVVSSKKRSKHVENFVKKLVTIMDAKDLELENKYFSTALHMAAVAGNIETVKIMVEKNRKLLTIMGGNAANIRMMPLHAAALFGNHEVVRYLYEKSIELESEDWNLTNLRWLLEKCVEGDMFDVALKIVRKDPGLGSAQVLRSLAGKPDAFSENKSNIIKRRIHSGKHLYFLMNRVPLQVSNIFIFFS
ncbi:putative ankyrin repeat-containing domain-containing protein [Helianthus anomalus]